MSIRYNKVQERYVYALRDPMDSGIFYIGSTSNPSQRLLSHCELKHKSTSEFIKFLLSLNEYPIMHVMASLIGTQRDIEAVEDHAIRRAINAGLDIVNVRVKK